MEAIIITKYDVGDTVAVKLKDIILHFKIRSVTVTKTFDDEIGLFTEVVYIVENDMKFYAIEENEIISSI